MPWATILESQRIGAPASNAARPFAAKPPPKRIAAAISTMPLPWIMRTAMRASSGVKRARSVSARMMAKERA
jgi:hypothetical protein